MATIIDELIVRLGLDPKGFEAGRARQEAALNKMRSDAKSTEEEIARVHADSSRASEADDNKRLGELRKTLEAKRRAIRELEKPEKEEIDRSKKHAEAIGSVRTQLVGLFGILAGAASLVDFIRNSVTSSAAIGRFSKNIGVATKDLSAWQTVVEENGGTADDAISTLHALAQAYQNITLRGDLSKAGDFQGLGISLDDLKSPITTLLKLQDAQKRMSPAEFENRVTAIGIAPGAIAALQAGPLADALEKARRSAVTNEDADTAKRLQKKGVELQKDTAKIGRSIITNSANATDATGRAVSALAHGDTAAAGAAARDLNRSMSADLTGAPPRAAGAATGAGTTGAQTLNLIKGFEGFAAKAHWDRNAWRVGYGSDTVTDASGRKSAVTKTTTTNMAAAERDLIRRINTEFLPRAQKAIGAAWQGLSASQKAAIVSMTYNYGRTPHSVVVAARSGNAAALSSAIAARQVDNQGINADRRRAEAVLAGISNMDVTAKSVTIGAGARVATVTGNGVVSKSATSSSETHIGKVEVHTAATDADGIARSITPALKRQFVPQFNTGLTV